ncbi:type II secretion system F family protein [Mobiluncus mulieris]|uniref:Type II secretion system F family protein n=1 Tax=Mobiluncus mulieris TaxID=2052 RepID=A0A7Y0U5Y0_9ACTO|nr:type II secretion system F family protein [Mobiluncus mulieris]MCU9969129.1 hypothetical protein [Mobiluncus mulieris]MCV0009554.1 hypothetical protein [Mobiluncus mulieris]NMW64866.1 type II secretion system F family protein [Mobiluncus mulieris]NMW75390.1 type II secretion system F family protein [Mobiluncus mulieris]NMX19728.1 type II secretion system F family protein [Mobiluncus mulieris]
MPGNILITASCAALAVACLGLAILVVSVPRNIPGVFPMWRLKPYLNGESPTRITHRLASLRELGLVSSDESMRRRIVLAGSKTTLSEIRRRQKLGAIWMGIAALLLTILGAAAHTLNPLAAIFAILVFPLMGVVYPDYRLSAGAKQRQMQLNQELPDAIELLALAVGAGESLYMALERVASRCTQVTGEELTRLMAELKQGEALSMSLTSWRTRTESEVLSHLVDAVVSALERGSPLAQVLREQVADSRSAARNQLLAQGGKKEIWMMIPVVFLILPLTVVFALYPGLVALQMTGGG